MQDNRKISLENQIASMLNQVMEDDNNNHNEEQLFSSDNEEEQEINNNNLNQVNNYSQNKTRIYFNNQNDNNNILNNHFIRKNQRIDKKFQTVNSHIPNNNPYFYAGHNRNYFPTQITPNPFNFNSHLINTIPNQFYINPNLILNNNNNNNLIKNIENINRSENRKKTYDAKEKNLKKNIRDNKKFASVNFPKETNLKVEMLIFEVKNILFRTEKIDHYIYSKIQGNIVEIIKTHKGSRIFQNYLKNTHCDLLHQIFLEINPHLNDLLIDPYANYFCRKFFTFLNQKDRIDFLSKIQNSLLELSSNSIGTFPVQGIIEHIGSKNEKNIIINIIKDHIPELSINPYSCHVIEKVISCFEEEYIPFIYDYVIENFLFLSYNANGICLIRRIVSFTHKKKLHEFIKKIVENNSKELIVHPYGNYVIQELVESWDLFEVKQSLLLYKNKLTFLSMEKYSSNVMEKYIEKSDEILTEYIDEIIRFGKLYEIMKNNYGNFVIQKALKISHGENKKRLIIEVSKNICKLNDKKLIIKWKDLIVLDLEKIKNENFMILNKTNNFNNI